MKFASVFMLQEIIKILGESAMSYEKIKSFGIIDYGWEIISEDVFDATLSMGLQKRYIEKIPIPDNSKELKGHLFAVSYVSFQ